MTRIDKGTNYEEYVCNHINKNNNNLIAYLPNLNYKINK